MPEINAPTAYEYTLLKSSRSIRLLRIDSSRNDEVQYDLVEVSLRKPPEFEALSYAWDSEARDHSITCNGQNIAITANCHGALKHLRRRMSVCMLWIDAICINQNSLAERNHQVELMGRIYANARRVLVWLGEGDMEVERLFSDIIRASRFEFDSSAPQILLNRKEWQVNMRPELPNIPPHTPLWDLLSRSWFQRLWTVQEIALSRECLIYCGKYSVPWDSFVGCLAHWELSSYGRPEEHHFKGIFDVVLCHWQPWHSLRWIHNRYNENIGQQTTGSDILRAARMKRVTNEEDKVYALYGILQYLGVHLPPPDYSEPVEKIYREVTLAVMRHDRSVSLLQQACTSSSIPSWVPDYRDPKVCTFPQGSFRASTRRYPNFRPSHNPIFLSCAVTEWNGSITRRLDPILDISLNLLTQLSQCLEMAIHPSQAAREIRDLVEPHLGIIRTLRDWHKEALALPLYSEHIELPPIERWSLVELGSNVDRTQELLKNFAQALTFGADSPEILHAVRRWQGYLFANFSVSFFGSPIHLGPKLRKVEVNIHPLLVQVEELNGLDDIVPSFEWEILKAIFSDPELRNTHSYLCQRLARKSMFVTRGQHVGFADHSIALHDRAVVLWGLDVPMVIRHTGQFGGPYRCDETVRLISPAYIHKCMNGELLGGRDAMVLVQ